MEPKQFFRTLWRHRTIAGLLFGLSVTSTLVVVWRMTPIYEATAEILIVQPDPALRDLFEERRDAERVTFAKDSNPIATHTELLKVTPLLRGTIEEAQLVHARQPRLVEPDELAKELRVTAIKGTDLIRVSYSHSNPAVAAQVVNVLCTRFAAESVKRSRKEATETLHFLETQNQNVKKQLERNERTLEKFKTDHQILDLKTDLLSASNDLNRLEGQLREAQLATREDRTRVRVLSEKLGLSADQALRDVAVSSHPMIQKLQSQLVEAQTEPILTSGVGEDHPEVRALRSRIKSLEVMVALEAGTIAGQGQPRLRQATLDPLREQLARELVQRQINLVTSQVKQTVLQAQLANHASRVRTLSRIEPKLGKLSRESDLNAELYEMFLKRREQARVVQAMEFGNVRIVQPAETPRLPVKPNLPQSLLASVIFGLILASGGALALDHFDDTLRDERRTRSWLRNVPIVGRLPRRRRKELPGSQGAWSEPLVSEPHVSTEVRDAYGLQQLSMVRTLGPQFKLLLAGINEPEVAYYVANLAVGFAQQGRRVLLIEGDMRKPVLNQIFGLDHPLGLRDLLTGDAAWSDVAVRVPGLPLWVVPAAQAERDPLALLNTPRLWALSQTLDNYDVVLGYAPGVTLAPDALALSGLFAHFWLVLNLKEDTQSELQRGLALLQELNMFPTGALYVHDGEF